MPGTVIERLENRRLFAVHTSQVLELLIDHGTLTGDFFDVVSGGQKIDQQALFVIRYLKDTNPTTKSVTIRPAVKGQVVSTTFDLHIVEPTVAFSSFPTSYKFTLNTKKPLSLFSFKEKDKKGDTEIFTGTLTLKTGVISGSLKITGPNRSETETYSVAPPK